MSKKINLKLSGVPQTLLLPLIGRAILSTKPYSPLHDPLAVNLVQEIDYDFDILKKRFAKIMLIWMARAYHFEQAMRYYLEIHPQGTIVNLGAGLDTTFYRLNNPNITWIDLDLPEVIALRQQLLPLSHQIHMLAKSVLDHSWMQEIKKYDKEFFMYAGGLFMYFTKLEVKNLFCAMADQLPNSELIFDTISTAWVTKANAMLHSSNFNNATMHWGIDDVTSLTNWSSKIEILNYYPYYKNLKNRNKFPFLMRMHMFLSDLTDKSVIAHLKFK